MDHRPFSTNGKNANDGHAAQKQVSRDAQQQRQRLLQPKSRLQMTHSLLHFSLVGEAERAASIWDLPLAVNYRSSWNYWNYRNLDWLCPSAHGNTSSIAQYQT
jgi:hypothetical protein